MNIQNLNHIPIIGWLISLLFTASLAVPFWLAWTVGGIGSTFFYFLPAVYLHPGFWQLIGLFISIGTIKILFFPEINIDNSNDSSDSSDSDSE